MKAWASVIPPGLTRRASWRAALAVAALLCTLAAWHAHRTQTQASEQVAAHAAGLAEQLAAHQRLLIGQAGHLLQVLSSISLPSGLTPGCSSFLARQLERFPHYDNLGFADTGGRIWCSARPMPEALHVPISSHPSPLPIVFGDGVGSVWLAVPGMARSNERVIAAVARRQWFPAPSVAVAEEAQAALLGSDGTLLATQPARSAFLRASRSTLLGLEPGQQQDLTDTDGRRWVAMAAPVTGAAQPLKIIVALPAAAADPTALVWAALALLLALPLVPRARGVRGGLRPNPPVPPGEGTRLRGAYRELQHAFAANQQHLQEVVQLDGLSRRLQSCAGARDVAAALRECARAVLPKASGWVQFRNAQGTADVLCAWAPNGSPGPAPQEVGPDTVRMPLYGHDEAMGVLWLAGGGLKPHDAHVQWLITSMAERASLALDAIAREERLRAHALRDPLTGLFNRRFLEETLAIEQQRARRRGTPVGLMMLDVDHFKHFNDSFGHDAGDALLRGLGALLRRSVREGDMACRFGGEEFVVILPGADLADTQERAEALRAAVAASRLEHDGKPLGAVTVSIGVAALPVSGASWQAALKRADEALYRAKRDGRNRVAIGT